MARCYWIGGLLGSTLFTTGPDPLLVWVGLYQAMMGYVRKLKLAPNGIDPDPTDGIALEAGELVRTYYRDTFIILTNELRPHGYTVVQVGFDWRKKVRDEAKTVADDIRAKVTAADPCALVAHSQGGLYARAVWANLVATNQQNLIRRIVTIGTPHLGSYGTVMVFSLKDEIVDQLSLGSKLGLLLAPIAALGPPQPISPLGVADVAATWPGFYELMPLVVPGYTDGFDPDREKLFFKSNWKTQVNISQDWLDYVRQDFHPFLRSPASQPPYWVLTTCAGDGLPTPYRLTDPSKLGSADAIGLVSGGDGRVDIRSGLFPYSPRHTKFASHSDEPALFDDNGFLTQLVLEERAPPEPPPPPPSDPPASNFQRGPLVRLTQGPPFNLAWGPKHDC